MIIEPILNNKFCIRSSVQFSYFIQKYVRHIAVNVYPSHRISIILSVCKIIAFNPSIITIFLIKIVTYYLFMICFSSGHLVAQSFGGRPQEAGDDARSGDLSLDKAARGHE